MTRLGRRSEFEDSEEEEDGYGGGDLEEEEQILWSYGISQRNGRSSSLRPEPDSAGGYTVDLVEADIVRPKHKTYSNNMLIPIIDRKMNEHAGKILHVVESLSIRLSKMDLKSRQLEASVDQLNGSFEWQHERTHEKLRRVEDIMKEIHGAVKDLKDKYEIAETQIELGKLQISKNHPPRQNPGTALTKEVKPASTVVSHHLNQQVISPDVTCPARPGVDLMYLSNLPYQNPPSRALTIPPIQLPPVSTHVPPPATPYEQPLPILEQRYGAYITSQDQEFQLAFTTPSISYESALNPAQLTQRNFHPRPVVSQQASYVNCGEGLQAQPQNYDCGPFSQFSGTSQRGHESEVGSPHFVTGDELFSEKGHNTAYRSYPYGAPTKYDTTLSHNPSAERRRSNFMQFPVLEASELSLPHALPMASFIDEEPNANSSDDGSSTDEADVIDKVTAMGFKRDIVKATVKKLKENGQAVDLNAVLDKLMAGG